MKGLLVIFTKDEEAIIEEVIDSVRRSLNSLEETSIELYLWDSSSDRTTELARNKSVKVIQDQGPSLGWSYYRAMKHFTSAPKELDFIITMDGDGQVNTDELPIFIETFSQGYDMVVGSRFKGRSSIGYSYPAVNRVGIHILSALITLATRKRFTDSHGGLRVMKPEVAAEFSFIGTHSYVQETLIDASRRGYKIIEIPSTWKKRAWGDSRVVRSPLKYARRMFFPILVRTRLHWLIFAAGLGFGFYFKNPMIVFLSALTTLALEVYGIYKTSTNQKKLGPAAEL